MASSRTDRRRMTLVVLALLTLILASATAAPTSAASRSASPSATGNNTTVRHPVATATTHPIEYQIGCPPAMVDDGSSLSYFKAHGFSTVYLVVDDKGTYQTERNTITSLGMKPVIDVEIPIWNAGQYANTPISSYASYFQSLKAAGWEYVASEGGRQGDADYLVPTYFKGYINFNCDQCGLWKDMYKEGGTVANSWESYYTSEWPYIQQGAQAAASLGKQNGVLAGTWANNNGNNQILANSQNGGSPSYQSMLDWSYANGCGFTSFHVWCGDNAQGMSQYKALGFEQIVAQLQVNYPAAGSPAKTPTTLSIVSPTGTQTSGSTYTLAGYLRDSAGAGVPNRPVDIYVSCPDSSYWYWKTVTTNGNGYWSTTDHHTQSAYYLVGLWGDSSYADSSTTDWVPIGTPTSITVTSPTGTQASGQTYWLIGYVTDSAGAGVPNRPVDIYVSCPDSSYWYWKTVTTDAYGWWWISDHHTQSAYYLVGLWGDSSYADSSTTDWVPIA
ncbi:MAG: hypothetical protein ACXV4B_07810 [Halobacteriota archaeon]